jgi:hypothetical protein
MAKHIAFSCRGGMGEDPTVKSANKAQRRTARNPINVARDFVILSTLI